MLFEKQGNGYKRIPLTNVNTYKIDNSKTVVIAVVGKPKREYTVWVETIMLGESIVNHTSTKHL